MDRMRSFYFGWTSRVRILEPMSHDRDRVISISLSEAEWKAFIARHPEPVDWLRDRIRNEVREPEQQTKSAA